MTNREWLRFAATYAIGAAGIAAAEVAFNALLGRPYRGVPTVTLILAPLFAVMTAFDRAAASSATRPSPAFVVKVMAALVIVGSLLVALVETLAHWEWGWRHAMTSVLIAAILLPLARVISRRRSESHNDETQTRA